MSAPSAARVEARLDPAAPPDYRALAARLACTWSVSRPRRVGLGGGQGAGKSTLARLIVAACAEVGVRAVGIGLDDFYRTRAERHAMAGEAHPLFATRGVPGTHDVVALAAALDALLEPGAVELPRFDKGLDDRAGADRVDGPFDLVLFEGWCVGAPAGGIGPDAPPINALEREDDAEGRWRAEVDAHLARDYVPLWAHLDELVFLQVPDLDAVRRWRLQQESSLPSARRLDAAALDRFVQHYERITLRMLRTLPGRADWTVELTDDHTVARVVRSDERDV
ncbi:MAG: kinase [Myxococcota bacterium]